MWTIIIPHLSSHMYVPLNMKWNSLISITGHYRQGIDIREVRERHYPLWEWSIQLWTYIVTTPANLYLYTKQSQVDKVGEFKLDVIAIMKLAHFEGTFCLHWRLWPLCGTISYFFTSHEKNKHFSAGWEGLRCLLFTFFSYWLYASHSSKADNTSHWASLIW